jgi:hypothetical protein
LIRTAGQFSQLASAHLRLGIQESLGQADILFPEKMLIKIGYDIALKFPFPTAVVYLLHVHPSRRSELAEPERLMLNPDVPVEQYYDRFWNHRGRILAPAGIVRFFSEAVIRDSGEPDVYEPDAKELKVCEIPTDALEFLLPSRYCEVDSELTDFA